MRAALQCQEGRDGWHWHKRNVPSCPNWEPLCWENWDQSGHMTARASPAWGGDISFGEATEKEQLLGRQGPGGAAGWELDMKK